MTTQRYTKIKKKKMYRYHSEKRYKRKRRGHYSHYKYGDQRARRANVRIYKSETLLRAEFESLVLRIVDAIFPRRIYFPMQNLEKMVERTESVVISPPVMAAR